MDKALDSHTLMMILCGTAVGTLSRAITLRVDTRQNPSYPNGSFLNLFMGFVAAALGSVAIPALLAGEYTAFTFIALAIQHFRDVRITEKESLEKLEKTEYAKRGAAYIDGIAKTYESRNYIALLVSLAAVLALSVLQPQSVFWNVAVSTFTGLVVTFAIKRITRGKRIGDICTIEEGTLAVECSDLLVDGMYVSNALGTQRSRDLFLREGVGLVVTPKKVKFGLTLSNEGQRQAMLFEVTRTFGMKRFGFTFRSDQEGKLLLAVVPIIRDPGAMIRVILDTPILENSRKIHSIMSVSMEGRKQ